MKALADGCSSRQDGAGRVATERAWRPSGTWLHDKMPSCSSRLVSDRIRVEGSSPASPAYVSCAWGATQRRYGPVQPGNLAC
eukprot:355494-Chlamydomonas_euryale.AAC.3